MAVNYEEKCFMEQASGVADEPISLRHYFFKGNSMETATCLYN